MPPLSPKTDAMMTGMPGADQEQAVFEESFSQMANTMLMNKVPELASNVVTFKIIDSDINTGSAVGAFILERPSGLVYIPVVLSDNQVKPLEIMYLKEQDTFVPLTNEWVDQIDRGDLGSLGEGVKTPESLYTDVDIRNLVVPPTTGRYSFASAQDLKLPEFLDRADNKTRAKLAKLFETDKGLLKVAVAIYGSKTVIESLRPRAEKVAAKEEPKTDTANLAFATNKSDKKNFKSMFGDEAPAATRGVAVKGYYAKDTRKNLKRPVNEESSIKLEEIRDSGAYRLFKRNGEQVNAFVFVRPHSLKGEFKYDKYSGPTESAEFGGDEGHYTPPVKYLVLLENGEYADLRSPPCGEPLQLDELGGKAKAVVSGNDRAPKQGKGIFVRNRGGHRPEGTVVVNVDSITTGKDGVKRIKASVDYSDVTLVIDEKAPHGRIIAPKGDKVAIIPHDYSFVSVGERLWDDDFISDPRLVASSYLEKLREAGAVPLALKKQASDGYYYITGTKFWGEKPETVYVLAKAAHISVPDAEEIVKTADEHGVCRVLIASTEQLVKLAEGEDKKKSDKPPTKKTTKIEEPVMPGQSAAPGQQQQQPQGGDPMAQGGDPAMAGQDPAMMGQDPAMMGGMIPDPLAPSLTDQAVQELQEEVSRAHEEQMKLLQHKIDALQMVSQRTQELAQGIPKEQSQALQQAVMTAGAVPTPGTMNAGEEQHGAEQPLDPSLMQEAGQLADPSMFDASAIGTLAEHGSMKDLVGSYMPTMEKSLDHVGRVLLTMWVKGSELRAQMGEENYSSLEDRLKNIFRGIGDIVLRLNQSSAVLQEGHDVTDSHAIA